MVRAAEELIVCPHCHKQIKTADDIICPHCRLPLSRRRRQATAHGGLLAKVIIQVPGETGQERFLSKKITTLGRHPDNLISLQSSIISEYHAQIELTPKGHTLTDLGSVYGTRLNGHLLTPHRPQLLAANDIIRFSDERGNSIMLTYVPPSGFTHVKAKHAGHTFQLDVGESYIGRGFDAAIVLPHPTISWRHTKVTGRDEQHYVIKDLSTQNGTFVNDIRLDKEQPLERGDVVQIGPFNLIYQGHGLFSSFVAERNFRVEVTNLEKTVYETNWLGLTDPHRPKTILREVSLVINPREFVAVVGSSGSGKSTLLKALLGLNPATGGSILVNGDDLYKNLSTYRPLIGYIPQDDIIHSNLRVRQALRYALQLRLPETEPAHGEKQIDAVLAKVGLTAQADTLVRNLSGGQRKRVSIAAELLADPWIFFLDEPTSGLDPGLEKLMMDTLRSLADEGRTIVLVTHATGHIIAQCDQVAVMARGGELSYFGPADQITTFFNVDNFPDIYTILAQTYRLDDDPSVTPEIRPIYHQQTGGRDPDSSAEIEAGSLWAEYYRRSDIYETYVTHRQSGEVARPSLAGDASSRREAHDRWQQFKILSRRYLDLIKADRISLWVLLAVMPLIGLFLLLIGEPTVLVGSSPEEIAAILETVGHYTVAADTQTILFMMALSTNLLGIFSAAYELIKEESIYRRERMLNLKVGPYFASKLVVLGAFMAVQTALFLGILALGLHFPAAGVIMWAPLEYYLTLMLTALAGLALGLFISALVSSRDMVIYLVLLAILIQIVFSGAIFELSPVTRPLSYLTITRWSLEALGISTDLETLNNLGQVRVEHVLDTGRGLQTLVKDVPSPIDFVVNYTRNPLALISRWLFLLGQIFIWSQLTIWRIHQKDKL